MVAVRPQLAEIKVEIAIGKHCQGAVGLVAFHPRHVSTPKVMLEQVEERGLGRVEIIVCEDAPVIIEDELTVQGAEIAEERRSEYEACRKQGSSRWLRPHCWSVYQLTDPLTCT